ncbi:uncharacterized protein BP5553_10382 [Venustampulla echinocandica]|uniref:P-loop containing nucleoside triphosphate hydrolase n=1 Tax=Venustampulla echinocandica TaxID=2656787 RepID=A0A370T951_9HELO|nr:uncharacterized protein BP5553_10382 [Venustampulla echinocandica]RDL30104.1 hypothetical protein BP5553_10382 [Venustampulla echinocandica]
MNSSNPQYGAASSTAWPGGHNPDLSSPNPQTALLELLFPGFSLLSSGIYKYTKVDLTVYFPLLMALGLVTFASRYISDWVWGFMDSYIMSTADIRIDDEMYNMCISWVANQQFAKRSRRFVANTNLNSRTWFLWREYDNEDDEEEEQVTVDFDEDGNPVSKVSGKEEKKVRFTPSFGTHYFWYRGRLLLFSRTKDVRQGSYGPVSEREEISLSSFGRNPSILKQLLDECRSDFMKQDESRTVIYRGGLKSGTSEPQWTRCVSRVSRPFSTVVLDEKLKQGLLDDMRDYLHPNTRRWYSNRGIPYRRGYLLHGLPGTGKTSLSFAIAGYFKLKIYIVSLNSPSMDENNLGTLFSELPKQCVVLLEDIDTAGLTHTRDDKEETDLTKVPGNSTAAKPSEQEKKPQGRISLSALLNILDGVASQEGRVLIMTTNHIEKLDEALIRPGRVDMMIKFDLATQSMLSTIFCAIFATLEGDIPVKSSQAVIRGPKSTSRRSENQILDERQQEKEAIKAEMEFLDRKKKEDEKVAVLGEEFANIVPNMTFSPAEVQGYLLKHKREPERAVQEAAEWVKTMMTEKKKEIERKAKEEEERLRKEKEKKAKEEEEKNAENKEDEGNDSSEVNGVKDD